MRAFYEAKSLFRAEPWLAGTALGLACALTALSGMRLNTIDGIYPVDLSLTIRHVLGTAAALAALIVSYRKAGQPILSVSPKRVFLIAGCFSFALLLRYSPYLFITEIPGLMLVGKLSEEFFGALLVLAWAERVVVGEFRRAVSIFGLAILGMGTIQVFLTLFQRVPCMLTLVVLPLVSAALFKSHALRIDGTENTDSREDNLSTIDMSQPSSVALICVTVLCFVFTIGQILQPTLAIQETRLSIQLSIAVGNALAGIFIVALTCASDAIRNQPHLSFALFLLAMFALTTITLSLVNYLGNVTVTVYLALASIGAPLIMLLVWALPFARLPHGWTPFMVVALGYVCNFFARAVSAGAMNIRTLNPDFPSGLFAGGALVLALCCSAAFIVRMTDPAGQTTPSKPASPATPDPDHSIPSVPPVSQPMHATPHKDVIDVLCDLYGLTAQEGRVLLLCSKGKNARTISEELGVSPNTTKSHMRVVYSKLGIHSQQELIKLVDEARKAQ